MRDRAFLSFVRGERFHAVYVITPKDAPDISKIGIASDPLRRLTEHQISNWEELRLAHYWWTSGRPLSARVEAAIKTQQAARNLRGEWFSIKPDEMVGLVERVAAEMCIPLFPEADVIAHVRAAAARQMAADHQWLDKRLPADTK